MKAIIITVATVLALGATAAPADAARYAPSKADSGWGCGGAC